VGSHLLFCQRHDIARQRRAALPGHSDPGHLNSVPLRFAQHHADCRAPYGATLLFTTHDLLTSNLESSPLARGATTPHANASWRRSPMTLAVRQPPKGPS
jgi:hypothetical protein